MKLSAFILSLSLLSTSTAVALEKRTTDGVHLVNCQYPTPAPPDLAVVYCPDDGDCDNYPESGNLCWYDGFQWEGTGSCTFSTGVTFTWTIESDAASATDYTVVGSGNNGYQEFTGRKDDNHVMFYISGPYGPDTTVCTSAFYFL